MKKKGKEKNKGLSNKRGAKNEKEKENERGVLRESSPNGGGLLIREECQREMLELRP